MAFIRRLYKLLLITLWLPVIGFFSFFICLGGWGSIRRVSFCSRIWGHVIVKILNIKVKVYGDFSSFKGGLIVSNHMGYLDVLVHASLFPIRFAPNIGIRSWPFLGWYLSISRPIWIDRASRQKSRKLLQEFKDTMDHNIPLLVYPEGTSTSGDDGILPFKSTSFEAVSGNGYPILPLITVYKKAPDGSNLSWHGKMTLVPHLWRILGHKEMHAEVHVMDIIQSEHRGRKELAKSVHHTMEELYWKLYDNRDDAEDLKQKAAAKAAAI
ncbi:lysophospholipid acyltransferase family protein [Lentisphaerota bacterium ZTH]|nr:1-acyl-sn-glycerol-3-phosphate acyltransferase [Lentisphaerota bacterium]WET06209.1 lysophospholipid acyltransferase family protein [Lentisphaerota bacterium ZTH]